MLGGRDEPPRIQARGDASSPTLGEGWGEGGLADDGSQPAHIPQALNVLLPALIRLDARLAQANNELQQAQVRSEFAHLVLGRECVAAGFEPPQAAKLLAEVRRLRS
jgi:hypothetical protein